MKVVALTGVALVFIGAPVVGPMGLRDLLFKDGPRRQLVEQLGMVAVIIGATLFLIGVLA